MLYIIALTGILTLDKVIPKDLSAILENNDPEDFDIVITKVDNETSNPELGIQFCVKIHNNEDNFVRRWAIATKQYRKSRFSFDFASSLQISQDHPILWQFSDKHSDVYFRGHCHDADKLYLDLYKIHRALFEDLLPFEDTLTSVIDFNKLMTLPYGLLASGPQKLMKQYADILEQHNLSCSMIGDRTPTYWDGEKHATETGNAKVLFIDDSYIIAEEFHFLDIK